LQVQYAAWLETLPENLQDSATAEALHAICDLDLRVRPVNPDLLLWDGSNGCGPCEGSLVASACAAYGGRTLVPGRAARANPMERLMPTRAAIEKRKSIIDACRWMTASDINRGTSGNISLRDGSGFLITPTSMSYDLMHPEDIITMRFDDSVVGEGRPSTEWRFHLDILEARPEVNALVHAHPIYCTTLAILASRPFTTWSARGDTIRCAPYATFGTQELSDNALDALKDRKACLLAHHGMIAVGDSLRSAMWLAAEVENLAHEYFNCLQLGGEPPLLTPEEVANVARRMANYRLYSAPKTTRRRSAG
jgi:L-fuculose-phosphate aldolase